MRSRTKAPERLLRCCVWIWTASLVLLLGFDWAHAERARVIFATPAVIDESNGAGFLKLTIPSQLASAGDATLEEAVLNVRTEWGDGMGCLVIMPLRVSTDMPAGSVIPLVGTRGNLSRTACVARRTEAGNRYTASLKHVLRQLQAGAYPMDGLLIGVACGEDAVCRLPVDAVEGLRSGNDAWEVWVDVLTRETDD